MKTGALWIIWERIVEELSLEQDKAPEGCSGHIKNPIIGTVYYRETAFAAKVFATEYKRTGDENWLRRAELSLSALQTQNIYIGLDEPLWKPTGVVFKKGSIPATALLLSAFWNTMDLLEKNIEREKWEDLISFLKRCCLKQGLFAHDEIRRGQNKSPLPVQNTAAMALFLIEVAYKNGIQDDFIINKRREVLSYLLKGQRSDGFWPYIYPGYLQNSFFRFSLLRPYLKTRVFKLLYSGGKNILFGDSVHHCYVLYYLLQREFLDKRDDSVSHIVAGWNWLKDHIIEEGGDLRFDFDWEPEPQVPCHCNFRDTTTYFLIINIALFLEKIDLIKREESRHIIDGLLKHIEAFLLSVNEKRFPCINPYEGPDVIIQNIFPRAAESVAWKGALLSDLILDALR